MGWLIGQFGRERLLQGSVILPTDEFFPAAYDGSEADARVLLDQVCQYMDIDPTCVDLSFYSERKQVALNMEVARPEGGTAGLYNQNDGRTKIWLEISHLDDPTSVAATFAHELCHAHLLGGNRISPEEEDHEPLTDLATVYFGMGIFTANATLRDKNYRFGNWEGWSISRQGYLPAPVLAYALALYAWLREEMKPDWDRYLRLDARSPFRKALSFVKHSQGAGLFAEEDVDPSVGSAGLRHQLGLRTPNERASDEADCEASSIDSDNTHLDDRFSQAVFLLQKGQWQEAIQLLSEVLSRDSKDGEAYQQRASAYLAGGKPDEAVIDAEKAVQVLPDDSESYRIRGKAYLALRRHDCAIADFTRYLDEEDSRSSNPARVAKVYHLRGSAYVETNEFERALSDFTKTILRWPQWPAPYESRAAVYERLGKVKKAIADRQEAAERARTGWKA